MSALTVKKIGGNQSFLNIKELSTIINTSEGSMSVLDDINFSIKKGEIMALVGESGSGKSMTINSILQLLPKEIVQQCNGKVEMDGVNLLTLNEKELNDIRGKRISLVAQNAMTSLDPSYRVGKQIVEIILDKTELNKKSAVEKVLLLFEQMGIDNPKRIFHSYPHQLSGGLRQRVVIAMSLACDPDLIIADEPTSALDPTVQLQVLDLFVKINKEFGTAILMITHDFGVVAQIAEKVAVMYAGEIVEMGLTKSVIFNPQHPYTQGLLKCIPDLNWIFDERMTKKSLYQIEGEIPNLMQISSKCRFLNRCPVAKKICQTKKPLLKNIKDYGEKHEVRCLLTKGERKDEEKRNLN